MKILLAGLSFLIINNVFSANIPTKCIMQRDLKIETGTTDARLSSGTTLRCTGTVRIGHPPGRCWDICNPFSRVVDTQEISHTQMLESCEARAATLGFDNQDFSCQRENLRQVSTSIHISNACVDNNVKLSYQIVLDTYSDNGFKFWKKRQCQELEICMGQTRSERREIKRYSERLKCSSLQD